MSLIRWEPYRDLVTTQDRFNRLFNDTFTRFLGPSGPLGEEGQELTARTWAPPVDILENDHEVIMKAEVPGVDPKDVQIRVEDGTLHLKGERKFEKEVKEENYHRVERAYGSFTRSFALPSSVNTEKAKAEYKDGVLTLTMPKREEAKPKTIQINVHKN